MQGGCSSGMGLWELPLPQSRRREEGGLLREFKNNRGDRIFKFI